MVLFKVWEGWDGTKTKWMSDRKHLFIVKCAETNLCICCWWAVWPPRLKDCRWLRSSRCPKTPHQGQNKKAAIDVCVCMCVRKRESVQIWVGHISLHLHKLACTYTQRAHAPSVFDMGELNDRGREAKKKSLSVSLPPSSPLLDRTPNINAPYGTLRTDLKKNPLLGLAHNQ